MYLSLVPMPSLSAHAAAKIDSHPGPLARKGYIQMPPPETVEKQVEFGLDATRPKPAPELNGKHPRWLLFEKYSRTLQGFVRRMVGNRDDADELFQELALAVLQHPKGPEQIDQFVAWCRGLAKHILSHYYRTKRRNADLMSTLPGEEMFDDRTSNPERHVAANEILDRVFRGIDARSRQMIVCRHLYGDSAAEIAEWTALSPAAVRMKLMRLRCAVRRSS